MISYEPLVRQLKEKSMTIKDLGKLLGIHESQLYPIMGGKIVPQTVMIEKICNGLNCSISDVIEYTDKPMEKDERYKINWDKITLSMYSLSLKLGKTRNAMGMARKLDSKLLMSDIVKIAELCNLSVEELINEIQ